MTITPQTELFPELYLTRSDDRRPFGAAYCGQPSQKYGEWVTVARYPKVGGDGQPVEIDECRMPTRFYRLRAVESTNSVGEPKREFMISTGSGDKILTLLIDMAKAITQGMLGLYD